jgi:hypothetical protein
MNRQNGGLRLRLQPALPLLLYGIGLLLGYIAAERVTGL